MQRAYTALLCAFTVGAPLGARAQEAPAELTAPPEAAPIHDAGLWLLVGGAIGAVGGAAAAVVLDAASTPPDEAGNRGIDFEVRALTRQAGVASTLLAITSGAVAANGLVFVLWPSE